MVIHPNPDIATNAGKNRKKPRYRRAERNNSTGLHTTYNTKNIGAIGVQYGIVTPNLVPSIGNVTSAITSNISLASRNRPFPMPSRCIRFMNPPMRKSTRVISSVNHIY